MVQKKIKKWAILLKCKSGVYDSVLLPLEGEPSEEYELRRRLVEKVYAK